MAFCKNCGEQLTDGIKFCGNCGTKVKNNKSGKNPKHSNDVELITCPDCGAILNYQYEFDLSNPKHICTSCGTILSDQYYCTRCQAILNDQDGFDPNKPVWVCTECGEHLFSGDCDGFSDTDIEWRCDHCNALLNIQMGFSDRLKTWTCKACGYKNSLTDMDIIDPGTAIFCAHCGKRLPLGAKSCFHCGAKVSTPKSASSGERKTSYEGYIHKCPNCGEALKAFQTICPTCKFELRGLSGNSSIGELSQKLERATTEDQKITIIENFPIPNTKEDIFEFMILASTNFDAKYYASHLGEKDISDAWLTKIEQCYLKAKFSFGNTPEFGSINELYVELTEQYKKELAKPAKKKKAKIISTIILSVISIVMQWIGFNGILDAQGETSLAFVWLGGLILLIPIFFIWVTEIRKKTAESFKTFIDTFKRNKK